MNKIWIVGRRSAVDGTPCKQIVWFELHVRVVPQAELPVLGEDRRFRIHANRIQRVKNPSARCTDPAFLLERPVDDEAAYMKFLDQIVQLHDDT